MGRKFKKKKKIKLNKLLIKFLFLMFFLILLNYILSIKLPVLGNINIILNDFNDSYNDSNYVINTITTLKNNVFNNPEQLLKEELNFVFNKQEQVNTVDFLYNEKELPMIYLYNSHQGETYSDEYLEEYNIIPNILTASHMLKEKLELLKINTIIEENNILEYMKNNGLNHAGSYIASRYFLNNVINKYNSIKLYIDIHRDAASKDVTYTIINGKECAKVLFVIGLENPNYKLNLEVTNKLNNIILRDYPDLTRGILKKQGYGVNGIYNQDLNPNIILLEVGGDKSNIEEVNNTLDLIALVIKEYLNEEK